MSVDVRLCVIKSEKLRISRSFVLVEGSYSTFHTFPIMALLWLDCK